MRGFAKTDVGKAREMNQDYYYIPSSESSPALNSLSLHDAVPISSSHSFQSPFSPSLPADR